MNNSDTMELYNKVGTQEKRAVNRLLRAMASGNVEKSELARVQIVRCPEPQPARMAPSGYQGTSSIINKATQLRGRKLLPPVSVT